VNILQPINRRNADWIGHILRRSCLLIHVVEVRIDRRITVRGRRRRRHKQLLDDLKEKTGYWKLKEGAIDHILW
jgi:hypothetical protein